MKLKVLVIVMNLIFFINCDKLTDDENLVRLINCGTQKLPVFPQNGTFMMQSHTWLTMVRISKKSKIKPHYSLGSFISPRHVLTSAQPFINDNQKWTVDGEQGDLETGCKPDGIKEVPKEYMKSLRVISTDCSKTGSKYKCERYLTPVKAWFIGCCKTHEFSLWSTPMIIETQENNNPFACIASGHMPEVGEKMHSYRIELYRDITFNLYYEQRQFIRYDNPLFLEFDESPLHGDKGGPVVREFKGRQFIYGVRAGEGKNQKENKFYDVRTNDAVYVYGPQMCTIAGICDVKLKFPSLMGIGTRLIPTAPTSTSPSTTSLSNEAPTSTSPSRTTAPSSNAPKATSPIVIAPKSISPTPSAPKSTAPSVIAPKPTSSARVEHHSELEKVPKKKKKKPFVYRVEPDIYVSADFLNGGEGEKLGFVLIFVLVFWVL